MIKLKDLLSDVKIKDAEIIMASKMEEARIRIMENLANEPILSERLLNAAVTGIKGCKDMSGAVVITARMDDGDGEQIHRIGHQ